MILVSNVLTNENKCKEPMNKINTNVNIIPHNSAQSDIDFCNGYVNMYMNKNCMWVIVCTYVIVCRYTNY